MAVLAGSWLAYQRLVVPSDPRPLAWSDLTAELGPVEWPRAIMRSFSNERELEEFLRDFVPGSTESRVRLEGRATVLVAVGPRSATGYSVEIVSVTERRGRVDVVASERAPGLEDEVEPRVTFPYRLIAIPSRDKPVHVTLEGR